MHVSEYAIKFSGTIDDRIGCASEKAATREIEQYRKAH